MPGSLDVLVLGDVNPDLVLRGENVEPAFGQAERLLDEAHLTVGGSGAILACGAARLGLSVGICGVVGDDLFGRYLREELTARGVDVRGVVTDPERPTGLTVVLSRPDDRGMLTVPGTIDALTAAAIDRELLASARHVHVSSYFLQTALRSSARDLRPCARGRRHDVDRPELDPATRGTGVARRPREDRHLPAERDQATRIARTSDVDAAVRSLATRAGLVVVKEGPRGAIAGGRGRWCVRPALSSRLSTPPARVTRSTPGSWPRGGGRRHWSTRWPSRTSVGRCRRLAGGVDGQVTMDEALAALRDTARTGTGRIAAPVVASKRWIFAGSIETGTSSPTRMAWTGSTRRLTGARTVSPTTSSVASSSSAPLSAARASTVPWTIVVAERLDHVDAHGRVDVGRAVDAHRFRPNPDDRGPVRHAGPGERQLTRGTEPSRTSAANRFIGGLPMNPATNRFAGWS